jgi:hypothetical protein
MIGGIAIGLRAMFPVKPIAGIVTGALDAFPAKLMPGIVSDALGAFPAKLMPGIVIGALGTFPANLIGGIFTVVDVLPVNAIAGIVTFDAASEALGTNARARPATPAATAVRARALRQLERRRTADIRKRSRGLFAQQARSGGTC